MIYKHAIGSFMKKKTGMLLIGIFSLIIICCQTSYVVMGKKVDESKLTNGVYEGESGHIDKAHVRVTVSDNKISKIELLKFYGTPFANKAKGVIPSRIIEKQSTNVDAVTGATEASNVIMNAVENAIQKSYNK